MSSNHLKYILQEEKMIIIITLIVYGFLGGLCNLGGAAQILILKTYEIFLIPFVACWSIYAFWDYVDNDVYEVYLSYPKSRLIISFSKIAVVLMLYLIMYSILFWYTFTELDIRAIYYIGTTGEIFFWTAIGYCLIICSRSIIISIASVWIYTAIQILDVEKHFSFMAIYLYVYDNANAIVIKAGILLMISVILITITQLKFNRMKL